MSDSRDSSALRAELEAWKAAAADGALRSIDTPDDLRSRFQLHVEVLAATLRERDDARAEVERLEVELADMGTLAIAIASGGAS